MGSQRQAFLEICQGFAQAKLQGRAIYFKHVDEGIHAELELYEENWRKRVIKVGLPTFKQALEAAYKDGRWDQHGEKQYLDKLESYNMFIRKAPKIMTSVDMIDAHFHTRDLIHKELILTKIPRSEAISDNAEDSAFRAAQMEEIRLCSFADPDFKIPFFEEFDYLTNAQSSDTQNLYYNKVSFIHLDSLKEIKKIACQYYFSHKLALTENLADFFGIPLWKLTHFQTYLLCFGRKFAQHLPYCGDAPAHFYEEPDKLEYYSLMIQDRGKEVKGTPVSDISAINKKLGR